MNAHHAIDLTTALWLGGIGACIGSFLNVVAYRLPIGMSVIWKPSHCPKCRHPIRARDNVPVFGWLWLRGRCRDCGEPISPRYAIVEFLMGLAFFALAYFELFSGGANLPDGPISPLVGAADNVWIPHGPLSGLYAYHALLLSLLVCVTLIDLDRQKVPSKLIGLGLATGVGLAAWFPFLHPAGPRFFEDASIGCSGLTGASIGWVVGMTSARLIALLRRQPLAKAGRNLTAGFIFLGAFLGWQGIFPMAAVLLIAGISILVKNSHKDLITTKSLAPIAMIHLAIWKSLDEIVRSLVS